jgi:Trk-type K+ transport system membrane component
MTALMALLAGGQTRLKESAQIRTMLEETKLGTVRRTVFQIVLITLAAEAAGALLLYACLAEAPPAASSSLGFFSAFHAVSAFCNAGFGLLSPNCADPVFAGNAAALSVIMLLVVAGGLGIPVLTNVGAVLMRRREGPRRARLSLHSKIVLSATGVLLAGGAAVIALIEAGGALRGQPFPMDLLHALFLSVSSRTAGFNSVDMASLGPATLYFLCLLMWVGASPASTGGGVKTTTLVVALANIHALVRGRERLELFRRRVPELAVTRAFSTVALSFFFIAGMVFLLLLTEGAPLQDLLFEVVSATGTVGLSTGITPRLSTAGKLLIVACMFTGRVGILSLVLALVPAHRASRADRTEEPVLIT